MSQLDLFFLCRNYEELIWELPIRVAHGWRRGLLGWSLAARSIDAGVPGRVAHLLATVLVRHAVVIFPSGTGRRPLLSRKWIAGRDFSFIHATQADEAVRLFNAKNFEWSIGAQTVFLSPIGAPPPILAEAHLDLARDGDNLDRLALAGVVGLLLPGVDGQVAGLYTFGDDLWNNLIVDLSGLSAAMGMVWREVSEIEFKHLLTDSGRQS
jgi:hypothetical protein